MGWVNRRCGVAVPEREGGDEQCDDRGEAGALRHVVYSVRSNVESPALRGLIAQRQVDRSVMPFSC